MCLKKKMLIWDLRILLETAFKFTIIGEVCRLYFFFFLFWWSFILFSQPIILRKVCVLEFFLAQSFRWSHYFFKEDLSFEEIILMQSFYVQLSLLPFPFPYFFLPSFLFISLTTKQDIGFQIQLIKKKKKSVLRILIRRVWIW